MGQLKDQTFVCFDVESTGLDVENDRIIEIAIVKFKGKEILERYETLIYPDISIPEESTAIHKITNEMVEGKPRIFDVIPKVLKMIESEIVVGHHIIYDIEILRHEAERHGIGNRLKQIRYVDTLRLARLFDESESNSLEALRKHFRIPDEGAHRAMNDVLVNIQVFQYLAQPFSTLQELTNRLKKPVQMRQMPLGRYKHVPFKEIPTDYLLYTRKLDFDEDLRYSINQELKKRRQKNNFQSACNPFSDL